MKKIWTTMLLVSLLSMGLAVAYDATTPFNTIMKWIVPDDTSFTVLWCVGETSIDFDTTVTSANVNLTEPDCQNASLSEPIITLTNTGNVNIDFKTGLNTTKPTFATLMINNANDYATADIVNNAPINLELTVIPDATVTLYAWSNLTDATGGTTERGYQINSSKSA